MKRFVASLALMLLAGCSGGGDEGAITEPAGPGQVEVTIVESGERSLRVFDIARGRLTPAASPARGRTTYSRAGTGDEQSIAFEEIYVSAGDGSDVKRLTRDRAGDFAPEFMTDGKIAFTSCAFSDDDGVPECRLDAIDPDSRERETLVGELGFVFGGDLSPDNSRFAFARYDERLGPVGIFVLELDAGDEQRIGEGTAPSWSPDADMLAFESGRDRNGRCLFHDCSGSAPEIYVATADGTDPRRLTRNPASDVSPAWSGDGEWILFARIADEEDDYDIWAVRADGECERQLTDTPVWETAPKWRGGGYGGLSC